MAVIVFLRDEADLYLAFTFSCFLFSVNSPSSVSISIKLATHSSVPKLVYPQRSPHTSWPQGERKRQQSGKLSSCLLDVQPLTISLSVSHRKEKPLGRQSVCKQLWIEARCFDRAGSASQALVCRDLSAFSDTVDHQQHHGMKKPFFSTKSIIL